MLRPDNLHYTTNILNHEVNLTICRRGRYPHRLYLVFTIVRQFVKLNLWRHHPLRPYDVNRNKRTLFWFVLLIVLSALGNNVHCEFCFGYVLEQPLGIVFGWFWVVNTLCVFIGYLKKNIYLAKWLTFITTLSLWILNV